MIARVHLDERVREWGLRDHVVEKDYVIGWVLWGIGADADLSKTWAFKGGTCLKKCFLETFRFSEDLDFTVLPRGPFRATEVLPILRRVLDHVSAESGIDFTGREPLLKERGQTAQGRLYYRGPRGAPEVASLKLDLSASEVVARPTELRPIGHSYPDALPSPSTVRCYSFGEVFAEKIRALGERGRPRDLYDTVHLFRRKDLGSQTALVRDILAEKCRSKGIDVPTLDAIQAADSRAELEAEWENMLGHQLMELPPFELFWDELPSLFAWLAGEVVELAEVPGIAFAANEDATWKPPPLVATWSQVVPLEVVRFAASNHLCVELGYKGTRRLIEPYSLRRTLDGDLVLHALRADTGEHRAYRVDRMQSLRASKTPFTPKYAIDFSATGVIQGRGTTR